MWIYSSSAAQGFTHRILIVSKIIQRRAGVRVLDRLTRGFATARRSNQGLYKTETGWNAAADSSCSCQRNLSHIGRVQSEESRASPGAGRHRTDIIIPHSPRHNTAPRIPECGILRLRTSAQMTEEDLKENGMNAGVTGAFSRSITDSVHLEGGAFRLSDTGLPAASEGAGKRGSERGESLVFSGVRGKPFDARLHVPPGLLNKSEPASPLN